MTVSSHCSATVYSASGSMPKLASKMSPNFSRITWSIETSAVDQLAPHGWQFLRPEEAVLPKLAHAFPGQAIDSAKRKISSIQKHIGKFEFVRFRVSQKKHISSIFIRFPDSKFQYIAAGQRTPIQLSTVNCQHPRFFTVLPHLYGLHYAAPG